ncbi:MAG: hemerythrin domain-containing protein [Chitinophaga rupis]
MYYDPSVRYKQVMQRYPVHRTQGEQDEFVRMIAAAFDGLPDLSAFADFSISMLIDYIRRTHIFYLDTKLPEIAQTILSLQGVTDADRRLLLLLETSFTLYYRKLDNHIRKEETLLLPYIEELCRRIERPGEFIRNSNWYHYSLDAFEQAHEDTEADLAEMRGYIKEYRPSDTDLSPYRILVAKLEVFEQDLEVHAFIEDEVLIPKARGVEVQLRQRLPEY